MKPEDFAKEYQCYKDLLGASDEELKKLLRLPCGGFPIGNYEDALVIALGRWIRYVTGVPFVKAYEDNERPDGQYGTIFFMYSEPKFAAVRSTSLVTLDGETEPELDICEQYSQLDAYHFQLDVYRDSGKKTDQEDRPETTIPVGSAWDVLNRLKMGCKHGVHARALAEYGMQFEERPIERIINMPPEKIKETYESRASCTFKLFACSASQMRVPVLAGIDSVEFDFDCEDDLNAVLPPEPEPPQEC